MAEEIKETAPKADEEVKEPEGDTSSGDTEPSKPDYEAELKAERERREKAEKAAADNAFKLREAKRKQEELGEEIIEDEDKPLTRKELDAALVENSQRTRKEIQSDLISRKAKELAGSDAEANLIIEIHKNRTFPAGLSLDEQLEEAYAIANRKSILAKNEELKRALRAKDSRSTAEVSTHRDALPGNEPRMSSSDIQAVKSAGYQWDGKSQLYTKTIKGGRVLTYDPKTKKRLVIEK